MGIKSDDYIVIVISSEKDAETSFLKKAGRSNGEVWCYAAMGPKCANKIISKPDSSTTHQDCYSFCLINAACWKCENDHQQNCSCTRNCNLSGKIKKLLENIEKCTKKIIVWTHRKDSISCNEIKKSFANISSCDLFSHQSPNHPVEEFMFNVCENNQNKFQKEFEKLIEYSLKKPNPHIIALSILCQGYLAAHGKINLPKDISISEEKKQLTLRQDWWEPALRDDFNGTKLREELETVDEDKKTGIEDFVKIIKDENEELYFDDKGKIVNDGMTQKFTGKVTEAYENLTKIL